MSQQHISTQNEHIGQHTAAHGQTVDLLSQNVYSLFFLGSCVTKQVLQRYDFEQASFSSSIFQRLHTLNRSVYHLSPML